MGNFKVEIMAVGGHGCDRIAREGEPIKFAHATDGLRDRILATMDAVDPDCWFRSLTEAMQARGMLDAAYARTAGMASPATLMHWPGDEVGGKILDDLANGVRARRSFGGDDAARKAYEGYCRSSGGKSLISGATLPPFDELSPEIRTAWKMAAAAVIAR